jgi:hypothetical protein
MKARNKIESCSKNGITKDLDKLKETFSSVIFKTLRLTMLTITILTEKLSLIELSKVMLLVKALRRVEIKRETGH